MGTGPESQTRADRRTAILEAAERLINHYGFDKTTVADIAKATGIGVGTVYLEFESKEAIAGELSRACHAKMLDAMRAAASGPGSFAHRLRRIFEVRTAHFRDFEGTGHHAIELIVHTKCGGITVERERFEASQEDVLVGLLSGAHEATEFHVDEPKITARALLQIYAAYTPPRLYDYDSAETARMLDTTHALLTRGLLRRA